jgi:hypothetical protein
MRCRAIQCFVVFLNSYEVVNMSFQISLTRCLKGSSLLIFLIALSLNGCATKMGSDAVSEYNDNPLTVTIPPKASEEFVEASKVRVLTGRGWLVQRRTKEEVVGNLVHRNWNATVTLLTEGSSIRILSNATQTNPSTGKVTPAVPLGWLKNLQKDLSVQLSASQ